MQDVYSPAVLDLAGDPGIRGILFSPERAGVRGWLTQVGCYHRLLISIQMWTQGLGEPSVCTIWRALFKKEHKPWIQSDLRLWKEQLRSSLTSWYCYPKNRVCLLLGIQPKIRRRKDLLLAGSKAITGALSQSSNIEVSLYCKIGEVLG